MSKENLKIEGADFWDNNPCGGQWTTYLEYYEWLQHTEPYIFKILDKYDWDGKVVADIGCGQGPFTNYIAERGAKVIGLDISFNSILMARQGTRELNNSSTNFTKGDAENLALPSDYFDVVVSVGVLHHTPDTQRSIDEVYRILKPNGLAIVMLYRRNNPKWWMTKALRSFGKSSLADKLRKNLDTNNTQGTALLELFGVPVLKAYSNEETMLMFKKFGDRSINNYQPGFKRMIDIFNFLHPLHNFLNWFDKSVQQPWGFYQVITAYKQ